MGTKNKYMVVALAATALALALAASAVALAKLGDRESVGAIESALKNAESKDDREAFQKALEMLNP